MYARVTTVQASPDKVDANIQLYRDGVIPAAKRQKGFKSLHLLVDRKTGKSVSVAFWETKADAEATGESSAYLQEILAKFASTFTAPPVVETYEVAVEA